MRVFLPVGGATAALGAGLLVWGIRMQVAWSDCQVHCPARSPWPVPAVGIVLLLGGAFFSAWAAVSDHAGRVFHLAGHDADEPLLRRPERPAGPVPARGLAATRRLAAMDVGSNTILALVADLADGRLTDVGRFSQMPEMGAEVDRTGRIGETKGAEAIAAMQTALARARKLGYEQLVAGATAAVRRAADGEEFLAQASAAIGVPVRLLSEQREAELSFLGAASVHAIPGRWLMGDMGGGSTELVVADGVRAVRWASLPVGSGRLASRFLSDPPLPGERAALRAAAAPEVRKAPDGEAEKLVMAGGTASNMPSVLSTGLPPSVLTVDDLRTAIERLDAAPAAELAPRFRVQEARVRALRAGAELLLLLLDFYGLDRFHVSHAGLRQGMILAYADRGDDWWR